MSLFFIVIYGMVVFKQGVYLLVPISHNFEISYEVILIYLFELWRDNILLTGTSTTEIPPTGRIFSFLYFRKIGW